MFPCYFNILKPSLSSKPLKNITTFSVIDVINMTSHRCLQLHRKSYTGRQDSALKIKYGITKAVCKHKKY